MNLVPIFNWFGNTFNGNTNNTFAGNNKFVGFFNNTSIFGKYMLGENSAIRATLGLRANTFTNKNNVVEDGQSDPTVTVVDEVSITNNTINLAVGYEMRRGGRLKGIFRW